MHRALSNVRKALGCPEGEDLDVAEYASDLQTKYLALLAVQPKGEPTLRQRAALRGLERERDEIRSAAEREQQAYERGFEAGLHEDVQGAELAKLRSEAAQPSFGAPISNYVRFADEPVSAEAQPEAEKPVCEVCGETEDDKQILGEVEVCRTCYMAVEHAADVLKTALVDLLDNAVDVNPQQAGVDGYVKAYHRAAALLGRDRERAPQSHEEIIGKPNDSVTAPSESRAEEITQSHSGSGPNASVAPTYRGSDDSGCEGCGVEEGSCLREPECAACCYCERKLLIDAQPSATPSSSAAPDDARLVSEFLGDWHVQLSSKVEADLVRLITETREEAVKACVAWVDDAEGHGCADGLAVHMATLFTRAAEEKKP